MWSRSRLPNSTHRQSARRETDEERSAKAREDPGRELDQVARGGLLGGRGRGGLPAIGEADGRGEERRECLAARQRRVGQGPGCAGPPPATQYLLRGGRVLPRLRADRGGPGQGGRRRPPVRWALRGAARAGDRADPVSGWQG